MVPVVARVAARENAASAEASLEVMQSLGGGFGRISPLGLAIFGFAIVALMAFFVVFEIVRSDSKQREKIDIGWQYFAEMAGLKRLTPQETDILRRIVEQGNVSSADMVFDSSFIYEDALEAFLKDNAELFKEVRQKVLTAKMAVAAAPGTPANGEGDDEAAPEE